MSGDEAFPVHARHGLIHASDSSAKQPIMPRPSTAPAGSVSPTKAILSISACGAGDRRRSSPSSTPAKPLHRRAHLVFGA
jgi:hypothetical protein